MSDFRRPQTAQEAVLDELRSRITSGRLPTNQVRQEVLAAELGVSRVPVREALKILVGEGLLDYEPHRGYFLRRLSHDDLREIYRIRTLLETELVVAAVEKVTDDLVAALEGLADDMERADEAGDLVEMQDANREFHFTIFGLAQAPHFIDHLRLAWNLTDAYRALYYNAAENRRRVHEEHRQVIGALAGGETERLVRLLDVHRQHAIEGIRQPLLLLSDPDGARTTGA